MGFLKPIDTAILDQVLKNYDHIITIEDGSKIGGLGSVVCEYAFAKASTTSLPKITVLGIPDTFIEHATVDEQQQEAEISVTAILNLLQKIA